MYLPIRRYWSRLRDAESKASVARRVKKLHALLKPIAVDEGNDTGVDTKVKEVISN
jgi:hypothetical protein